MITVYEAIFTAICEEQSNVGLQPFTGRIGERISTNATRIDGMLEDCQRVMAMAAALITESAHDAATAGALSWEEIQLEVLNDMQDLLVNLPLPDPRDESGIHDIDRVFIVFPNVPYMHKG